MKNKETRKRNILKAIEDIDNKIRKLCLARDELSLQIQKIDHPEVQNEKSDEEKKEQSRLDKLKFQKKLTDLQSSEDDPIKSLFFQSKLSEEKLQDLTSNN